MRIDTQRQQQRIEGHLHHPSRGKSIAYLLVSHAYDVNALRKALKQSRDGAAVFLPLLMNRQRD